MQAGHEVTLSLPTVFEQEAKAAGLTYHVQTSDDVAGMVGASPDIRHLLEWTRRVIDKQFEEFIPIVQTHDLFVATNTEFAAPSIAEYCGKPLIRTTYAPFLPGKLIPPPVMPVKLPAFISAGVQWKLLNLGLNMMVKQILNKNRVERNLSPIADQGEHAPSYADNFLMYSRYLGEVDPQWKYTWTIGGYCFNDNFSYDEKVYQKLMEFITKDSRPSIFFTLGSCNAEQRDRFSQWLFDICQRHDYKLVIGCGWWKVGSRLHDQKGLFLLDKAIPHYLIFPACDAIIHHGGSGTTHSASRAGKPQMVVPLLLDQYYWGQRVYTLGLGPGSIRISQVSKHDLEKKVLDVINNPSYKENAAILGENIKSEPGIQALCDHIARYA
jgi:UDP:flavonoid glycosyltransferase YjiC (YdhE family)